ncbi:MAG: Wzz/FepE/Etk N-terminal domain-containing protein, partial [Gammaproteobacteria bacterium]
MGTIDKVPKDERYQLLPQDPRVLQAYPEADEISLVDLWLVLVRRKWLIFISFTLLTLLGLAYYFTLSKSYEYTTAVEIGTTLVKEGNGYTTALIDPPETVLAKLNESYIPWVQHRYFQKNPDDETLYKLEASIPKDSELIVIKGKGPEEDESIYLAQMQQVLQRLFQDHERQTVIVRSGLMANLARAREKLAELQDPSTLEVEKKSLEGALKTLQIRLDELRDPRIMALAVQKLETDLEQQKKALINLKNQEHLYQAQYRRLDQVDELLKKQIADLQSQIEMAS